MALEPRAFLRTLCDAALMAADPAKVIANHLPAPPAGRTIVVGAGKAAAAMARALESHWPGPLEGLVVTRYDHTVPTERIEVVEAAHPVPDAAGHDAARRILALAEGAGEDDLLLCLISGGGSALLSLPAEGLGLEHKQQVNAALLRSGATITEMNCVRKHLSAIKGGRLAAAAYPARVVTLCISDVPGDDPAVIASGPTVPDPTSLGDVAAVLEKYALTLPVSVHDHLANPEAETPKPGSPVFDRCETRLISRPQDALEAAAARATEAGVTPLILSDCLEGEAGQLGIMMAGLARQARQHGQPAAPPCVLLSGGETTVTLSGEGGRGGRNCEFLLSLAVHLDGLEGVSAVAIDTDGIDGSEDNAGAFVLPDSLARGEALGLDAKAYLRAHDSYSFFAGLGDLLVTGPTLTNVNDFRALLIA